MSDSNPFDEHPAGDPAPEAAPPGAVDVPDAGSEGSDVPAKASGTRAQKRAKADA